MPEEKAMKNALWMLIIFCVLTGFEGNMHAADVKEEIKSAPIKDEKASTGTGKFDETTKQYLKKLRSLNAELVATHRELHNYNNPDKSTKGINMGDILNQESASREAKKQQQTVKTKKADAEERINNLQKDVANLKIDLIKYYNGKLPKNVSDALQTEENYTAYLISRNK